MRKVCDAECDRASRRATPAPAAGEDACRRGRLSAGLGVDSFRADRERASPFRC